MNTTPACLMAFLRGPGHGWYTAAARACFVGGAWALTSLSSNLGDLFATTSSDSAGLVEMWADAAALLLPRAAPPLQLTLLARPSETHVFFLIPASVSLSLLLEKAARYLKI